MYSGANNLVKNDPRASIFANELCFPAKMYRKINRPSKTSQHRPSMGVVLSKG